MPFTKIIAAPRKQIVNIADELRNLLKIVTNLDNNQIVIRVAYRIKDTLDKWQWISLEYDTSGGWDIDKLCTDQRNIFYEVANDNRERNFAFYNDKGTELGRHYLGDKKDGKNVVGSIFCYYLSAKTSGNPIIELVVSVNTYGKRFVDDNNQDKINKIENSLERLILPEFEERFLEEMLNFYMDIVNKKELTVVASYSGYDLGITRESAIIVNADSKIKLLGKFEDEIITSIEYCYNNNEKIIVNIEDDFIFIDIPPYIECGKVNKLRVSAASDKIRGNEKTFYFILTHAITATYEGMELSQNSKKATRLAVGSKLVLNGGNGATAISYQFRGLTKRTTETGTGAVNANIDPKSAVNVFHTLKMRAVYGSTTSEEKVYYFVVCDN